MQNSHRTSFSFDVQPFNHQPSFESLIVLHFVYQFASNNMIFFRKWNQIPSTKIASLSCMNSFWVITWFLNDIKVHQFILDYMMGIIRMIIKTKLIPTVIPLWRPYSTTTHPFGSYITWIPLCFILNRFNFGSTVNFTFSRSPFSQFFKEQPPAPSTKGGSFEGCACHSLWSSSSSCNTLSL